MITAQNLSEFRLVKITYEHTLKEYELFEKTIDDEDAQTIMSAHKHTSTRIRRRNNIVDWIWTKKEELIGLESVLKKNSVRYKLVDHTETYYKNPEKLAALRNEIDEIIEKYLTTDFVLDRIGLVGIENITKLEKIHIEKESKR